MTIPHAGSETDSVASSGDTAVKQRLEHLIFRKHRTTYIEVGAAIGWHPHSLGKCISGNRHVPAWLIPRLYTALGREMDVFAPVTQGTDVVLSQLPALPLLARGPFLLMAEISGCLERLAELEQQDKTSPLTPDQEAEYQRLCLAIIEKAQGLLQRRRPPPAKETP